MVFIRPAVDDGTATAPRGARRRHGRSVARQPMVHRGLRPRRVPVELAFLYAALDVRPTRVERGAAADDGVQWRYHARRRRKLRLEPGEGEGKRHSGPAGGAREGAGRTVGSLCEKGDQRPWHRLSRRVHGVALCRRIPGRFRHRDHAGGDSRPQQSPLPRRESVHSDHEADLAAGLDAVAAVYREGSEVDGGPCRVHGGRLADSGDDGIWSQFVEEGVSARGRHRAAFMV